MNALLIPLPYLLASTINRHVVITYATTHATAPLLHSLILSSATLTLVGLIARIFGSEPLDKRKDEKIDFDLATTPKRVISTIFSVFLPFYASVRLGLGVSALVYLVAIAGGLGALDRKPGKYRIWDDFRRTLRTRKATCAILSIVAVQHYLHAGHPTNALLGQGALFMSIFIIPPPFPTTGWSIRTGIQATSRLSVPKPSSPLINTFENATLTTLSGLGLAVITVLYAFQTASRYSLSSSIIGSLLLSVASATAQIYLSLPSALRSQRHIGLILGCILLILCLLWEHYPFASFVINLAVSAVLFIGALKFDTWFSTTSAGHTHSRSLSSQKHSHDHHHDHHPGHHLHGNHSRLSAFLIARTTPGSILHSVMIEKDSRRIAYFGV